jgi:hypothetical protein
MPGKEKVSTDANIDVAMSLRAGLLALGFKDADIARGSTTLTKIIRRTVRTEPEPNQRLFQRHASNKQPPSYQTVLGSSDQRSIITASAENSAVFHLENPSVLARMSKKRKRKNKKEHSWPITYNVQSITSRRTPIPQPRNDGGTTQADIRERQRTETGDLVRNTCSRLVANAMIAEHSRTPVIIADSVDANNHDSPAPQPSGLDRPEHSRSSSLLSPPSSEAIDIPATALISGSGEELPLVRSTRQSLPSCKSVWSFLGFITLICY